MTDPEFARRVRLPGWSTDGVPSEPDIDHAAAKGAIDRAAHVLRFAGYRDGCIVQADLQGAARYADDLARDNRRLRRMLAFCYGGAALYADDGELLDGREHPTIDFRRDRVDAIAVKMRERADQWAREHTAEIDAVMRRQQSVDRSASSG